MAGSRASRRVARVGPGGVAASADTLSSLMSRTYRRPPTVSDTDRRALARASHRLRAASPRSAARPRTPDARREPPGGSCSHPDGVLPEPRPTGYRRFVALVATGRWGSRWALRVTPSAAASACAMSAQLAGVAPSTASAVLTGRHVEARMAGAAAQGAGAHGGRGTRVSAEPRRAQPPFAHEPDRRARLGRDRGRAVRGRDGAGGVRLRAHPRPAAGDRRDRRQQARRGRHGARDGGPPDRRAGLRLPRDPQGQDSRPPSASCRSVLFNCVADPLPGPAVVPDEVEGGREAAKGLLLAGHREGIYVMAGRRPRDVLAGRHRLRGIRTSSRPRVATSPGSWTASGRPRAASGRRVRRAYWRARGRARSSASTTASRSAPTSRFNARACGSRGMFRSLPSTTR